MIDVFYYRVHDTSYPRNRRIRQHLTDDGRFALTVADLSTSRHRLARAVADVITLWRGARSADVVVLSEMRLTHAPIVAVLGRLAGARVVVDCFIGRYETLVGDWQTVPARSPRAAWYRCQDWMAEHLADLVLIDTSVRADALASTVSVPGGVVPLPVGAPHWATWQEPREESSTLEVLYYGNYIPLHGLDVVVDALVAVADRRTVSLRFVGNGELRASIERRVEAAGLGERCRFEDAVPEKHLLELIRDSDVVLGVFGSSTKAQGVIANKVWQGLACGRTVITRDSAALDEIAAVASPLLVSVPATPDALADALVAVDPRRATLAATTVTNDLEEVVAQRFDLFADRLATLEVDS